MADYPAALPTWRAPVNNKRCTLTVDYTASDATIYVTDTTGTPAAPGAFHMGTNIIFYTGKTATTFTGCTGGNDGTADQDALRATGGNEVVFGPEAHYLTKLQTEVTAIATALAINLANVVLQALADAKGDIVVASGADAFGKLTIGSDGKILSVDTDTPGWKSLVELDIATETDLQTAEGDISTNADGIVENSKIVTVIASGATPTPVRGSIKTFLEITAQTEGLTFGAPTGTPLNGDALFISLTDNGTTRSIAYNAIYDDPNTSEHPTDTTANKTITYLYIYSVARTKWELVFVDEEA